MRKIFVAGIGTDVGKTIVSAVLTEALKADYWKPVQTGSFFATDSVKVKSLISNEVSQFHPEAYNLHQYMSPHAAAELEGVTIHLSEIKLPESKNENLIIEGAGGLMVPLNDTEFVIDMINKFDAEVILVCQNYLGSINHTLLSVDALKQRGCKILGLVFNGAPHELTKNIVLKYSGLKNLLWMVKEKEITKEVILKYAEQIRPNLL
jgi:dethiobiotin synthetase